MAGGVWNAIRKGMVQPLDSKKTKEAKVIQDLKKMVEGAINDANR